jgi:hypothetical protein
MTPQELKDLLISKGVREDDFVELDNRDFWIIKFVDSDNEEHELAVTIPTWEKDKVLTYFKNKHSGYFRLYENINTLSKTIGIYNALKS